MSTGPWVDPKSCHRGLDANPTAEARASKEPDDGTRLWNEWFAQASDAIMISRAADPMAVATGLMALSGRTITNPVHSAPRTTSAHEWAAHPARCPEFRTSSS